MIDNETLTGLLLLSLNDFVSEIQLIFRFLADGVQFSAFHQVVDILTSAAQKLAGFVGADNPVPDKPDEIIQ